MVIRQNITVGRDDESRSRAALDLRLLFAASAEKRRERSHVLRRDHLLGGDGHDARHHERGDVGE